METLLSNPELTACPRLLLIGDFNLYHDRWEMPRTSPGRMASRWVEWADLQGLVLTTPFNIPTHRQGGTLDLAWASAQLCRAYPLQTTLSEDLDTFSDHRTLCTTIPRDRRALYGRAGRFNLHKMDQERFLQALEGPACLVEEQVQHVGSTNTDTLPGQLDALATSISTAIHTALQASAPQSKGLGLGYAWWDKDCQAAARSWRLAQRQYK